MFRDPAGQFEFDVPLGWGYDPDRSHLLEITFRRWKRPEETLWVRAVPTLAHVDAPLDEWYVALREQRFSQGVSNIRTVRYGHRVGALFEIQESRPEPTHRHVLALRGIRQDVIVEHRIPEAYVENHSSQVLNTIGSTMQVWTNQSLPQMPEEAAILSHLSRAHKAVEREGWHEVIAPSSRAASGARSAYLYRLIAGHPDPEIPAIHYLIQALIFQGQAAQSLTQLRAAEQLARRAMYTLRYLPHTSESMATWKAAIASQLANAIDIQVRIAEFRGVTVTFKSRTGMDMALLRIRPLLKEVEDWAQRRENWGVWWPCWDGVADIFTVLAGQVLIDPGRLPPEVSVSLNSIGMDTPPAQAAAQIFERSVAMNLVKPGALRLLADLRYRLRDLAGVAEVSQFEVEVARELLYPAPESILGPQDGANAVLADRLIRHVDNLIELGDEPSLEDAYQKLNEATNLLDEMADEGESRAYWCQTMASLLRAQGRPAEGLEAVERGLRALESSDKRDTLGRSLEWLRAYFLLAVGHADKAREIRNALVRDYIPSSTYRTHEVAFFLAMAQFEAKTNNTSEVIVNLRFALEFGVRPDPLGPHSSDVLLAVSELLWDNDPGMSYKFHAAAVAVIEAQQAGIESDEIRVGFGDALVRRGVYEKLVDRLLQSDRHIEVVAATDLGRGRALVELLSSPPWTALVKQRSVASSVSDFDWSSTLSNLGTLADFVFERAVKEIESRGAISPLRPEGIKQLASEIKTPLLVIQPVFGRIALLLVQPSGKVFIQTSPFSFDETLLLMDTVRAKLRIHSVPRGDTLLDAIPDTTVYQAEEHNLSEALSGLWSSLIGPVHSALGDKEALVIVPYRDFTLIPFALLIGPDSRYLIEDRPLSIVPSLATLSALRTRGRWPRPRPSKAYIVGDPKSSSLLGRLPAAREEARGVKSALIRAGLEESAVTLRLDTDATERSYRREATGADLVHLACHGRLEEPASASRLYFAPSPPYDGLLTPSGIADVRLDDALVYLSACETGQGRATSDGVVGLGRAFLQAGARAVILSLWRVHDRAAEVLAGHFYQALLNPEHSLNAAEAMQSAMLATRDDLEAQRIVLEDGEILASHPRYWAAFTTLGDPLVVKYQEVRHAGGSLANQ